LKSLMIKYHLAMSIASTRPSVDLITPTAKPHISPFKTFEKIISTVNEMFIDRGYVLIPKTEWSKKNSQIEDLRVIGKSPKTGTVFVYFATDIKVHVKKIREYIQHMEENKVNHAVIVYAHQITPGAKSELTQKKIETFQSKELFENITRHALVPRHEQVQTDQEVQSIMKKFHIQSKNEFPIYYTSDPVVRYYGWDPGTVIKIERRLGGLKDPEIYYRIVRSA
jgi:DNA-directed RNA polymerase subunit H (RpoH/RPB5)